ncbi:MAG: glycosyltransferase family 2 protein [Pseudomonadota bacterium]
MANTPRWAAVGTMDEPAQLILSWAAHHLSLGAAEVHIYLDRENPDVEDALRDVPNAFVTLCDDAYWAASERRARPIRHTARQKHNATQVYRTRDVDWVMHCDADEFLDLSDTFLAELAESPARVLRLWNIERVRMHQSSDIFAGAFRGPTADRLTTDRIYGRWADFLEQGMAGYKDGKDIVRVGEPFTMGVHFPINAETNARHTDPMVELSSARILHFDGLTPLHNVLKLLKRASEPKYQIPRKFGPQRERQFRFAKNHVAKPVQMRKMLDGVFGMTNIQGQRLGEVFTATAFDPEPALKALGLDVDLSVESFDRVLRDRERALIAKFGLRF